MKCSFNAWLEVAPALWLSPTYGLCLPAQTLYTTHASASDMTFGFRRLPLLLVRVNVLLQLILLCVG